MKKQKGLPTKNKVFIDTNIFIEIVVRFSSNAIKCSSLFKDEKVHTITTSLTISEVEWVLRSFYKTPKLKIVEYFKKIISLPNLEIDNRQDVEMAFELFEKQSIDWVDCLNAAYCQNHSIKKVYSYDHDFNKLKFLTRLEP